MGNVLSEGGSVSEGKHGWAFQAPERARDQAPGKEEIPTETVGVLLCEGHLASFSSSVLRIDHIAVSLGHSVEDLSIAFKLR